MDQVTSETDNTELKERCIELQTGLTGNVVADDTSISLDGADLHTVHGSVGSGGSVPSGGYPWRIPTTPTAPTPITDGVAGVIEPACPEGQELYNGQCIPKCPPGQVRNEETGLCEENLCVDECDDTDFENIKHQ